MTETALAAAFNRAGYSATESQLYTLACEMIAKSGRDPAQCHRVIEQAWADMRLKSLPDGGHPSLDAQRNCAAVRQPVEGGEGQVVFETHCRSALLPSPNDGGGGHTALDAHLQDAYPAVIPRPAAPSNLVPVTGHIRSKPGRARGADAIAAVQGIMAKAIVFRLTDGRDIMDAQFHELAKIEKRGVKNARTFTREAMVARYLLANVTYANPDPFAKVGDLFPPKTIELAVAEADKEVTHAA